MKLLITEKPSQVRDIAAAMGYSKCPEGAKGPGIICTPALGHILTLMEPDEVIEGASWSDPSTLMPVPRDVGLKPTKDGKDFVNRIAKLAKEASEIIVATDPDREGEGIGREILDYIKWRGPVKRLWLVGGMDKASVKKAMSALKDGSETVGFYRAQQARSLADWQYTLITRGMTAAGRHGCFGANLGAGSGRESVVSVGRVQTPTLALVVKRDLTIENFVPMDYYSPWIDVAQGSELIRFGYKPKITEDMYTRMIPGVTWQESEKENTKPEARFTDATAIQDFVDRIAEIDNVEIVAKESPYSRKPPKPYSLGTMQQAMNKIYKTTAKKTLAAAQALYQEGYLSYPRTEREAYPADLFKVDAEDIINALAGLSELSPAVSMVKIFDGGSPSLPACYTTKPMEHFALMPTRKVPPLANLSTDQRNLYMLVAKRYIECHLPDATGVKLEAKVELNTQGLLEETPAVFAISGNRIDHLGWMEPFAKAPDGNLPVVKSGSGFIEDMGAEASKTKAPNRYTEASLLADMKACGKFVADKDLASMLKEVTGIGTPATRDSIIETLVARSYIDREKGGKLISTKNGRDLIKQAPGGLAQVEMTARWEQLLADMEALPDAQAIDARDAFIQAQSENADTIITACVESMKKVPRRASTGFTGSGKGKSKNGPTDKMLALAERLAAQKGVDVPPAARKYFDDCRAFIDAIFKSPNAPAKSNGAANQASDSGRAPSEKMLNLAIKIAERANMKLPDDVKSDFKACKNFLDKYAP